MTVKKEYIAAGIIALLVIIFVNAPIVYFTFVPKTGLHFLGRRVINSQDMYTYLSFIEQSKQGRFVFENLFTTEAQKPSIIRPSYLLIGKAASLLHLTSVDAYQLSRIVFSLFFCVVLYFFLQEVFPRTKQRLLAFFLILTSSGFGWVLGRFIEASSDTWIPESNIFMSLAESPHFILSQTLMLVGFFFFLKYLRSTDKKFAIGTLLCCAFLAFDHPFDLMIMGPVILCTGLFTSAPLLPTLVISFLSTIGIVYPLFELKMNPVFASEQAQGVSYSPSPMSYLSGIGLLFPLSLVGANRLLSDKRAIIKLVLLWMGIGIIMLYAPVSFQRRLSEGISLPLGMLASMGVIQLYGMIKNGHKRLALIVLSVLICVLTFSSIKLVVTDFQTIGKDSLNNYYYYISNEEYEAYQWIESNTKPTDVILSNWFYGNPMPGITGRRVYVGHKAQTIHYDEKVAKINAFLVEGNEKTSKVFLTDNGITYIYVGSNDSLTQYGFKPEERSYLEKVFDKGGVRIFKVK